MVYQEKPKSFSPRFSVVSGILIWKGKTLLLQRRYDVMQGGKWGMPGGKMEKGEKPEGAMVREIHEETGISVPVEKLVLFRLFYVDTLGTQFNYYLFSTEFSQRPDVHLSDEHLQCKWVALSDVLTEKLVFDHPFCMKQFLKEYLGK